MLATRKSFGLGFFRLGFISFLLLVTLVHQSIEAQPYPGRGGGGGVWNPPWPWPGGGGGGWPGGPNNPGGEPLQPNQPDNEALREFLRQPSTHMPFYVKQTEWTQLDENDFGMFVAQIGRAVKAKKCRSVKSCMRNPEANRWAKSDPKSLILYADCADFPYFLRAYYAYKVGLPMGYVNSLTMNQRPYASANDRDSELQNAKLENSPYGNSVVARGGGNVAKSQGREDMFVSYISRMFDQVSTRTLRISPLSPSYDRHDFYPVKLNRDGIKPGGMIHSTGHAGVIFDIDNRGVVSFIDAHPDGSISYKIIKPSTMDRSRPDQGLGFFAFRPLRLVDAKLGNNGAWYGGKLVPKTDVELYDEGLFSLEQWFGPGSTIRPGTPVSPFAWKEGYKRVNFFDFLQKQLQQSGTQAQADEEVVDAMNSLCEELRQRVSDVDLALSKRGNLNRESHPTELPRNIFSASGPWEEYSTPGRDGRLRSSAQEILKIAVKKYRLAKAGDPSVLWNGSAPEYSVALGKHLTQMDKSCVIHYTNSRMARVGIKFSNAVARLNRMSFDPYHCAEKRWGASGNELNSCQDMDWNNQWYDAQKYMRNFVGKINSAEVYVVRSDRPITMSMLHDTSLIDRPDSSPINLGTRLTPITNLRDNFKSPKFLELLDKP